MYFDEIGLKNVSNKIKNEFLNNTEITGNSENP